MPRRTSHTAVSDYEAKISHEMARLARGASRIGPEPFGDPLSGIVFVAEPATGENAGANTNARVVDALRRSIATVRLDRAYVTWTQPNLLEEMLSLEPSALVAVGPSAARAIDALDYPLVTAQFSTATEGAWFAWTDGASGLRLPALGPALDETDAKHRFWRAFLAVRTIGADEQGRT